MKWLAMMSDVENNIKLFVALSTDYRRLITERGQNKNTVTTARKCAFCLDKQAEN